MKTVLGTCANYRNETSNKIHFRYLAIKETLGQAQRHSPVLLAVRAETGRAQVQKQPEHNETLSLKEENIKNNNVNFIDLYSIHLYTVANLCVCISCEYLVQQKLTFCKYKSSKCYIIQMFINIEYCRHVCVVGDGFKLMLNI